MKLPRLTLLSLAVALAACGGSDDPPAPAKAQISGTFLDGAVEGLEYVAGTAARAATGSKGEFTCAEGDMVSFTLGGIALGSATCGATITPLQLAGATDTKDAKVVNRLLALQLLDEDNDPANGIRIAAATRTALASKTLDFSAGADAFNTALAGVLTSAGTAYASRTVDDTRRMLVREHFEDTLAAKLGAPVVEKFTQGAVDVSVTRYQIQADAKFYIPYEGSNAKVKEEFPLGFLPSFGSSLAFKGTNANGDLEFYGLTDRGPNGDGPNVPSLGGTGTTGSKIFPAPGFVPSLGIITIGKNGAVLQSTMPIKASATVNTTGLPIPEGSLGNSAEIPVMDAMKFDANGKAVFNANGLDTEAVAYDKARNALWISDEYGPFIVKVDAATGIIQNKYAAGTGLPKIFAKRRANRGMEGLALDTATDKLHGFLQSPLSDGSALYSVTGKNEQVERFARFTRWIEFDPKTGTTTKMYAYPIAAADYQDGRTGNAKLGDVVALGNGKFIVIEQGADPKGKVFNKLMLVEIGAATDISAAAFNADTSDLEKSSMAGAPVNGADWTKVVPLKKTVLLDLNAIGWLAEKAEGLTIVDANTLAIANDNDFGLKTKIFTPAGDAVADADVTKCTVDASGTIVTGSAAGCNAANTIRGARGVGNAIGTYFIELAQQDMRTHLANLPDRDLAYLKEGTQHYDDYVEAVGWAQKFARLNREVMMRNLIGAVRSVIKKPFETHVEAVNCHHNYVQKERHFGQDVLVTRKGAVSAKAGELGIIPGSMGARSYIVRGKGNEESFTSCSHGAGRTMSRSEAKRRFTREDQVRATQGVECRKDEGVVDEIPMAYKDIDAVMHAQRDLVEVVHTLKQVVCVKG